ncbi:hypothetical protein D3C85_754900 [compost metagenome]
MKLHPQPFALRHAPINDADHLTTPLTQRSQTNLPAGLVSGFKHRHVMATLTGDPRRFQPSRAGTDHQHLALDCGFGNVMRHGGFPTRRCVVDAVGRAALVDAIQTIVGAHARANVFFALLDDFAHDVRIGHVRAGHAHHVHFARGDRVARGGDIGNLRCVEGREAS